MKLLSTCLIAATLLLAGISANAECVTFMDSDCEPAYTVDTTTKQVTFSDPAASALARFQLLGENDPLPDDLAFLVREAAVRYAVLDLSAPRTWTARDVREVFRSPAEITRFFDTYYGNLELTTSARN